MGVDALMYVAVPHEMTDEDVRLLAVRLQTAMLRRCLWVHKGRRQSVTRCARDEGYAPAKVLGEKTALEVHLSTRYYGPGYERGDLVGILAIARYLRTVLPTCHVFYGGDSDVGVGLLDLALERDLWTHFCGEHARDYHAGREQYGNGVVCGWCKKTATNNMWGGGDTGHHCISCGRHWLRRAGGEIVETQDDYRTPIGERYDVKDRMVVSRRRLDAAAQAIVDGETVALELYLLELEATR